MQPAVLACLPSPLDKDAFSKAFGGCQLAAARKRGDPRRVLAPQQYMRLKNVFGDDFELPRSIPFTKNEHVRMYVKGMNLIVASSKDSSAIPLFFLRILQTKSGCYKVASPSDRSSSRQTTTRERLLPRGDSIQVQVR